MTTSLELVNEYLQHERPEVRKNATTALSVLDSPGAATRLMAVALTDTDETVRTHAESVIKRLSTDALRAGIASLEHELENPLFNRRAYRLIGKLRPVRERQSPRSRLRELVVGLKVAIPSRHELPGRLGSCLALSLSGLLFVLLWIVIDQLTWGGDGERSTSLVFCTLIIGMPLATIAGACAFPVLLHANRPLGLLAESLRALACGIVPSMLVWAVLGAVSEGDSPMATALSLVWLVPLSTRLGVMLPVGTLRSALIERVTAVALGSFVGLAVVTMLAIWLRLRIGSDPGDLMREQVAEAWWGLLPTCGALSAVFAHIDAQQRLGEPLAKSGAIAAGVILAVAFSLSVPLLTATAPSRAATQLADNAHYFIETGRLPFDVEVKVTNNDTSIEAFVPDQELGPYADDYILEMSRSDVSGRVSGRLALGDDPAHLFRVSGAGSYMVQLARYGEPRHTSVASIDGVLDRIESRLSLSTSTRDSFPVVEVLLGGGNRLLAGHGKRDEPFKSSSGEQFNVGDSVRVVRPADSGEGPGWVDLMDEFDGKVIQVETVAAGSEYFGSEGFSWDPSWVVEVKRESASARRSSEIALTQIYIDRSGTSYRTGDRIITTSGESFVIKEFKRASDSSLEYVPEIGSPRPVREIERHESRPVANRGEDSQGS